MTKLLHFFSVAVLTQVVLMLSQLVLLPLQIKQWGQGATANWYSAIAIATLTYVVDCGLRTAGHAELLAYFKGGSAQNEENHFRQVWSWIRLLVAAITVLLIGADACYSAMVTHLEYPLWKGALTAAYSLETLLIIRIGYLDSLGFYRGAEVSYFLFAALRLVLSIPALAVFHATASGLAWLFLSTSAAALTFQGRWLCRRVDALKMFARFPQTLSLKVLGLAGSTVAEPVANWVRLSLPVLVISSVASPAAVTTYVALRAAFGAGRTTIQQMARVASVEYLRFRAEGRVREAESLLLFFVLLAGGLGTAAAVSVTGDNLRLLGLWLTKVDRRLFQEIVMAFAASAPFYAYQIPLSLMFRGGELSWVARRHYLYCLYAGIFAAAALQFKSLALYLLLLAGSEIALAFSFMMGGRSSVFPRESVVRGVTACVSGSAITVLLWATVRWAPLPLFQNVSLVAFAGTTVVIIGCVGVLGAIDYCGNPEVVRVISRLARKSAPASA